MKAFFKPMVLFSLLLLISTGCVHEKSEPASQKPPIAEFINKENQALSKKQISRTQTLEKTIKKPINIEPVLPKYDPLDDHKVSFSLVNEKLETVLYLLAETVGMNLLLDSSVGAGKHLVTLNFKNVSAKTVLKELAGQFDLAYKIDGNVIRISTTAERFFSLNFLDTNVEMKFNVGGDVLGGGGTDIATGLTGSVTISGTGAEKANPYMVLEEMLKKVKSEKGILSINKISGTLYVKDKPSIVKTISKLLSHYKEMLSHQILIEARIIEVTLSKGYSYGIDWELLKANNSASGIDFSQISWDVSEGLVFNGLNSTLTFNSIITALETFGNVKIVSNPTIRAKHGRPAIISVGDSISYKKSVEREKEVNDGIETETVTVEVSTVFDGLLLGVIPFIEQHGAINLFINPVKSDVDTSSIEDTVDVGESVTIALPKVGIKEISTSISLNDGDVIVLGGLISSENNIQDKDVPLLSKVPVVGKFFQNDSVSEERKELVIILDVKTI